MSSTRLASLGSILADDTRSTILTALMGGRSHTLTELAEHAGVARSTASEHLTRLLDAGMVSVAAQGRHRYFRLAGVEVADLLEVLGGAETGPPLPRAPSALAYARTCYDHLAGELAVRIYDGMVADGQLEEHGDHIRLTAAGRNSLASMGVDMETVMTGRRPAARACLDWTERRHHLAGGAGAGLLVAMLDQGWVIRGVRPRSIRVTALGRRHLADHYGIPASR